MSGDLILTFFSDFFLLLALVDDVSLDLLFADFIEDFVPHIELESVLFVFNLLQKQFLITETDLPFVLRRPLCSET